ncbi:hypothetical protein H312_02694 [Anncaliia algerae PRA339]|uniref:Uncharacterized protein n=1 Tax=Anncaliia algerae PRA339 TaxID=1288291 RepID=A0A059EYV9_9MICR|nr:hypothetical protein H312_02694 [Anncaliia algerae PRA339]
MYNHSEYDAYLQSSSGNVKERIAFFESLNKKEESVEHVPKELKEIQVSDNQRDINSIILDDKQAKKYYKERNVRINVTLQLKDLLYQKESDICLKPKEILKNMRPPNINQIMKYNKYMI